MNLRTDLGDLEKDGVIDAATAEAIKNWYEVKRRKSSGIIILGILGTILICLGIVLVIAHNWDSLSKITRTTIGFLPVLIGQGLCLYTIIKNRDSSWREVSSIILFFATGVAMAVIGQVYHSDAELHVFLFTWMLLVLPIIYLMRSYVSALLYIAGITWYGLSEASFSGATGHDHFYWLLLAGIIPFAWKPIVSGMRMLTPLFHWFLGISIILMTATLFQADLIPLAYAGVLACYFHTGSILRSRNNSRFLNAFTIIGIAGSALLYIILSFDGYWNALGYFQEPVKTYEIITLVLIFLSAAVLWFINKEDRIHPAGWLFLPFLGVFFLGFNGSNMEYVCSLFVLAIGLYHLVRGLKQDHLGWVNTGLFIIGILTLVRFFDSDISFIIRGLMFILTGAGFFLANWWVLKNRKNA